jgi:hypothetical protein
MPNDLASFRTTESSDASSLPEVCGSADKQAGRKGVAHMVHPLPRRIAPSKVVRTVLEARCKYLLGQSFSVMGDLR